MYNVPNQPTIHSQALETTPWFTLTTLFALVHPINGTSALTCEIDFFSLGETFKPTFIQNFVCQEGFDIVGKFDSFFFFFLEMTESKQS